MAQKNKTKISKYFSRRICYIVIALVLVLLAVFVVVKLFKNSGTASSKYLAAKTRTIENLEDTDAEIYNASDVFYLVSGNMIRCINKNNTELWTKTIAADGTENFEIECIAEGQSLIAYEKGGKNIYFFEKKGLVWQKTVETTIDFVSANFNANAAVVCKAGESEKALVELFTMPTEKDLEDQTDCFEVDSEFTLIEKKYTANYVISASVSDDCNYLAIGELTSSDSVASTKITLLSVETGKNYFSKVMDNEVCPFVKFMADNNLIVCGNKSLCRIEVGKSNAANAQIYELLKFTDEDSIISVAASESGVACVGGNSEGLTALYVFDGENFGQKTLMEDEKPKIVFSCGESFGVSNNSYIKLVNSEGKILGTTENFAVIEDIYFTNTMTFAVRDSMGITICEFS